MGDNGNCVLGLSGSSLILFIISSVSSNPIKIPDGKELIISKMINHF